MQGTRRINSSWPHMAVASPNLHVLAGQQQQQQQQQQLGTILHLGFLIGDILLLTRLVML
jgi:hypothetical protein